MVGCPVYDCCIPHSPFVWVSVGGLFEVAVHSTPVRKDTAAPPMYFGVNEVCLVRYLDVLVDCARFHNVGLEVCKVYLVGPRHCQVQVSVVASCLLCPLALPPRWGPRHVCLHF